MLAEHFRAEMGRIIGTFGKTAYSEERMDLIHRAIRGLTNTEFSKIVGHFISSARQAPLPRDFAEAAMKERSQRVGEGKSFLPAPPPKCSTCSDAGILLAQGKKTGARHFIHCECQETPWGNKLAPRWLGIPTWGKRFEGYFLLTPIDGKDWRPKRFDPEHPTESLADKAEEWRLKIELSRVFWREWSGGPA